MTAPSLLSNSALNGGASITITTSGTFNPGDVMVVTTYTQQGDTVNVPTAAGQTWVEFANTSVGSTRMQVFYYVRVSGTGSFTTTFSGPTHQWGTRTERWHGADTTTPLASYASSTDQTASAYNVTLSAPSITGSVDAQLICSILWRNGQMTSTTTPADMTLLNSGHVQDGGTFPLDKWAARKQLTVGGATGTKSTTTTMASGSYIESVAHSYLIVSDHGFKWRMGMGGLT